ncbi:MAG: ribosome silencing factor [Lachnospiraceae bacterium]|nr:ribosome silencing factor [Lachnospiraceae bacterium]
MQTKELTAKIYQILDEKKAIDISVIDIGSISVIADYFVVASASNQNQLLALQDAVDEMMYKNGIHAKQIEGNRNSTWILMDYEDIIVHLFSKEDRLFYDLERIWKDGKTLTKEELMA